MRAQYGADLHKSLLNCLCQLIDCAATFRWSAARRQLGILGGTGDTAGANARGRPFERMRQRSDRGRLAPAHSRHQHFGLPFEQLQDFPLQAAIAECHGRELAKAVEVIDHSNQRAEDSVNERRVQLDSLVATLDIRTEDLEKRLSRFSGLLDESLEAASSRAREVARLVSEASAEGTRAISEQYERVRENAEEERLRATGAMREIYEQTTGDTHTLFHNANERFAEAVQGMRATIGTARRMPMSLASTSLALSQTGKNGIAMPGRMNRAA